MRLLKFSHACVRVESDAAVLVIDPGTLTERSALDGADAVLITHEHVDHLDVDALADELGKRPSVRVFTHAAVAAKYNPPATPSRSHVTFAAESVARSSCFFVARRSRYRSITSIPVRLRLSMSKWAVRRQHATAKSRTFRIAGK